MVSPRPLQKHMDAYYQAKEYGLESLQQSLILDAGYYPDSRQDAKTIVGQLLAYSSGNRFMDVGAGVGFFSSEALSRGCGVTALEPNPNSAAGFETRLGFLPLQKVLDEEVAAQFEHSQDMLLMSQVLEHICDVEGMLAALSKVLVPGGVVAVAVPHFGSILSRLQGRRDMYISPPEHINYFSVKGLNALFERHDFECLEVSTVSKVPKEKITSQLPPIVGTAVWRGLYAILKLSERFGRGMVINAYYRKT